MQRILKYGDIQNSSLTSDKDVNILIYWTTSYVTIHRTYALLKIVRFFGPPCIYIQCVSMYAIECLFEIDEINMLPYHVPVGLLSLLSVVIQRPAHNLSYFYETQPKFLSIASLILYREWCLLIIPCLDLAAAKSSIFGSARNFFGSLSRLEPKITAQQQSCTQR